ncbi:hypothetical protein QYF36_017924 [Acer negundo]|nr:hypothetical protein QYF36_017924 [Acer negundo]
MRRIHQFVLPHALLLLILITTVSPATEKEILLQFKGKITDDPLNSLVSWVSSGSSPCESFRGVSCNPDGFVDKIVLWNFSLAGVLSPALSGLKSLRVLTLFGNRFSGNIPLEYANIQTLWKINVSSNSLSGSIPEFIGDLPNIRLLDLSKNGYSGQIPFALFKYCYKTKFVSLSHNKLFGSIPVSIANCSNLEGFDFSYNNLSGELPSQVCDIPVLDYISLVGNALTGSVQQPISNCQSMNHLDLSSNMFSGLAPFGALTLKNISYFNVSHNGFRGEIPDIGTCGEGMEIFDASWNELTGDIPLSITNCRNLKFLDLGFNRLTGSIPTGITGLERLLLIRLGNNSIDGSIPLKFGSIEYLEVLDLHNLKLVGEVPNDLSNCQFLRLLDVSGNALEGEIPPRFYNMTKLEILDLHRNQLNGSIPPSLGNLSKLQCLDLSQNSFSGTIPLSLENLNNLVQFNLSFNNLSGTIPSRLQHFGALAFVNNSELCGAPLETSCSSGNNGVSPTSKKPKVLSVSAIVAIVAAAVILAGVCVVSIMNIKARRRRREDETMVVESTPLGSTDSNVIIGKLVLFSKSLPSKYEDWEAGTKALLDKESLIGGGSIGSVYRTSFEGGVSIAVKKLETMGRIRNQDEFELEIGRLGNLRHPNLVAFQGYYWSSTMQLLLTEFIPNGNLYDNLHGLNYPGRKPVESPSANEVVVLCEYVRELLESGSASACFDRSLLGFAENELIQVMKLGLICTSEIPARRPSMNEVVQSIFALKLSKAVSSYFNGRQMKKPIEPWSTDQCAYTIRDHFSNQALRNHLQLRMCMSHYNS